LLLSSKRRIGMELLRQAARKALHSQNGQRPLNDVTELAFTGVPVLAPDTYTGLVNLKSLSMVAMKPAIATLRALPDTLLPIATLRALDLSDNAIRDEDCSFVHSSSNQPLQLVGLKKLLLENNRITAMQTLKSIAVSCPNLEVLDLNSNPVSNVGSYREQVFTLFPSLVSLDGRAKDGTEVEVVDSDESTSDDDSDDDSSDEGDEEGVEEEEDGEEDTTEPVAKAPRTE